VRIGTRVRVGRDSGVVSVRPGMVGTVIAESAYGPAWWSVEFRPGEFYLFRVEWLEACGDEEV
jgi:hypothetical protein